MTDTIDPTAVGIEVSWSFGYGDADAVQISREDVRRILIIHGFTPNYVPDFGPSDALKRALRYAPSTRDVQVKALAKPRKDSPIVLGVYIREAVEGEAGDEWIMRARVRAQNGTIAVLPPESVSAIASPKAQAVAEKVAGIAASALNNCANVDLSKMLCEIGRDLRWISRRRIAGGVYFLPTGTDKTRKNTERFVAVLQSLSTTTEAKPRAEQFIPQMHELFPSPMTMSSWKGSAYDAFTAEVEHLETELVRMTEDGKMRDKTKEKRAEEADDIIEKAALYSQFLDDHVDSIKQRLATVRDQFRAAIDASEAAAVAVLSTIDTDPGETVAVVDPAVQAAAEQYDADEISRMLGGG